MADNFLLYSQINCLEDFAMIGGTDYTLEFTVYEQDGITPQDIGGATIYWCLSPFGQAYNILQINGTITGTSTFDVDIPASATVNLSGKYIQQPVIYSFFGQIFRPAQGTVLIGAGIQPTV